MANRSVDKANPIPRYLQARRILEDSIRTGAYRPGDRLPGERELALQLQISQMTVNRAVLALVSEGWLRRETGNGTFVREDFVVPAPEVVRVGFATPVSPSDAEADFYLGALLQGVRRAAANTPVSLTVQDAHPGSVYQSIAAAPVDGWLFVDMPKESLAHAQALSRDGKRVVIVGADRELPHVPFVDSDNYGGGRAAMSHLLGLGHRRIAGVFAYIDSCNSRWRYQAYRDALREAGTTVPDGYEVSFGAVYPLLEPLYERVRQVLQASPQPTAFFCGGYYIALETMKAIQDAGLRIPQDVSVVGFDDPVSARYFRPALTTVRQPLEEMGRRAVQKLHQWLVSGEEPCLRDVLPVELVVRESAAPPPGRA